jgi:ribosomal protein S18 acetylase RimI-like enzyme
MQIKILKGPPELNIVEKIIELDKANMKSVLDSAGMDFPEFRRRESLKDNPTLIIALKDNELLGYLEFTRSWNNADRIYISSIQIEKRYRNTKLVLQFIEEFRRLMKNEEFSEFETNVQKNNLTAIKLLQKIGFVFRENTRNPASWQLLANRKILDESPIIGLLDKWRKSAAD